VLKLPVGEQGSAVDTFELRAGQYILTNPNIAILQANSPFASAGFASAGTCAAAKLYHPGIAAAGGIGKPWRQRLTADLQVYRNPNQIQLASTGRDFRCS